MSSPLPCKADGMVQQALARRKAGHNAAAKAAVLNSEVRWEHYLFVDILVDILELRPSSCHAFWTLEDRGRVGNHT